MTGLDLLLAVAGLAVTLLVVAGMILITPRGQVEVDRDDDARSPRVTPAPDEGRRRREPATQSAGHEAST